MVNPFVKPDKLTLCVDIDCKGPWPADTETSIKNYSALHDMGTGNGVYYAGPPSGGYPQALAKATPYWVSLWGHPNITPYIYAPADWMDISSERKWYQLKLEGLTKILRSGPFATKGLSNTISLYCKFKTKWLFGGPSPTEEINPGGNPADIPPSNRYKASKELHGIQIRDPGEVGKGVMHGWDTRRGLLTARGLQRLIHFSGTPGEQTETELLQGEEEAQQEEESSWEQTEETSEEE